MLIPKLYHLSFLYHDAQCTCLPYLVWCNANFHPTAFLAPRWHICTFAKNHIAPVWIPHAVLMYIIATRLVNLGLPKAFVQLCKCIFFIYKPGVTYSSKLSFAILVVFYLTVIQLVPKLQHVISKTVSLMCKS